MYLNCHTGFSFKYGTLPVLSLFEEAQRCGVHKLVITEINNTASYIEMLRLCSERSPQQGPRTPGGKTTHALEIAVGVEFRKDHELLYIAIAKNNAGFEEINRFLSYHNREDKPLPDRAPAFENVFVVYTFQKWEPELLRDFEFVGVRIQELNQLAIYAPYAEYKHKFVALHPVTFANKTDFNIHRLLRSIHHNTLLSKLPEHYQAQPNEMMMPADMLAHHFQHYPDLIQNAENILTHCHLDFTLKEDKNKKNVHGSVEKDWQLLEEKTWEGYAVRYAHHDNPDELAERINRELRIIRSKNFCSYYLIAYHLISFAKQKGYDFVGRGSGANSVVAYCLGITNVDPIELDLYFERFLNEERTSPPDFDIDFSWDNRDEIYDYIFNAYGMDHVCLLGTHTTYKYRSILRELGKVFGLPKEEIDAMVEEPAQYRNRDHITELIFKYAGYIVEKELPANISIHAGGVLITEKPIYAYTATELPPKGYPVSHFEMHNAEDMGIYKFDILSQRGLGHLKETVKHVKRNQGIDVNIHQFNVFKEDEKVKDLLRNSKAMGCFYVESPAMRMLLEKLRCSDYLTLVAASSIIRPGVASSGMMRAYIERFHLKQNGGRYESIHPKMDELMAETYGVMVYQEDVIKVANKFADLTLTEADVLRRGMSGKYRSREEFQRVRDRFFENCARIGYPQHVTDRVWFEIESFSGYSFAKGHSASYAVESYQSLYLKAHYPLEFMVGVINNFGGFYRTEFYFHEARMNGATIEAPCANRSHYLTTIDGTTIFIGFIHLKSLETAVAKEISEERLRNGDYKSLDNFLRRITLGLEQIRILIRLGTFRFTGKTKQQLLWEAMLYFGNAKQRNKTTADLFDTEPKNYPLPMLQRNPLEDAFDEIELLGFPLCNPFPLIASPERGDTMARDLKSKHGKQVHIVGYVITTKNASTLKSQSMFFGTFYDERGEVFDTVHFPDSARKYPFRGRGFYSLKGKVTEDFGVYTVEVSWMDKLPIVNKRAEEFMREGLMAGNANPH
ncbi:DNA polymerase III subunit alpha [Chryseolinea lacunae]|uniref:DNA-directed DNA polymerase n=1 Tax=Chryseolinea lacunae TaxID=2801331 RepID=A0ABS1KT22_9BACT|nr:DNA polymerase III subunit alpha [Chryseolinea lacunae]MBL0742590.1 DNA polymerase III subunit alpha [Chryseolinea lacunae]